MNPRFPLPWLVADIGGTNARFGLVGAPGMAPVKVKVLRCGHYPSLVSAMAAYLHELGDLPRPRAACVAVAGPVDGDRFRLTNGDWDFSVYETKQALGLDHLELVNDFVALAMALPRLPADAFLPIGSVRRIPDKPMAVIGPGTGLGVAGLVPAERRRWLPVSGEGGHVTIPVETELEAQVALVLQNSQSVLSAETVLSGPGLVRLYRALCVVYGRRADPLTPEQVSRRGRTGRSAQDVLCGLTLRVFCGLLGSFAGNVALTMGARGGIVLGGGILPTLGDMLTESDFRRRFEGKPAMAGYLSAIATELITAPTPALLGASAWLTQQQGALNAA